MFFFIISKENVLAENLQNSHCDIKEGKNIKNKTFFKKTIKNTLDDLKNGYKVAGVLSAF